MALNKNKLFWAFFFVALIVLLATLMNTLGNGNSNRFPEEYFPESTTEFQPQYPDFRMAAEKAAPAVVHIRSEVEVQTSPFQDRLLPDPFRDFFGDDMWNRFFQQPRSQKRQSSGSGVIISADGHIITNYHVINRASELEVILESGDSFMGEILGTDPSTDLALIKIEAQDLPTLSFGNSDDLVIGEWVLAVGNPFNLTSTVTAGIVSAKARNINILTDQNAIESFIQTDAAVNPGNSGGALVNTRGELVGITTAIATPTGSFAGYAFAIPSNLTRKVANDLLSYGSVHRGYLGVFIRNLEGELAQQEKYQGIDGVYVDSLAVGGAGEKAGIKRGDVIIAIDGQELEQVAELQAAIGVRQPGDKVNVQIIRDGREITLQATLLDLKQQQSVAAASSNFNEILGAELKPLSPNETRDLGIEGGLEILRLGDGKISQQTDIRPGFIILKVDNRSVSNLTDLNRILDNKRGGILIEGIYRGEATRRYYGIGL